MSEDPYTWNATRDRHEKAVKVLAKVRNLFSDKNKWTGGSLAKDEWGREVPPDGKEAVRFCAAGAIMHVARNGGFATAREAADVQRIAEGLLAKALHLSGGHSIPHVNDGHNGYERIMAGLAKATGISRTRRDAALKGWDTRRKRAFDHEYQAWLREREAASVDPRPEVMSFGGTITVSPVTERKEVGAGVRP